MGLRTLDFIKVKLPRLMSSNSLSLDASSACLASLDKKVSLADKVSAEAASSAIFSFFQSSSLVPNLSASALSALIANCSSSCDVASSDLSLSAASCTLCNFLSTSSDFSVRVFSSKSNTFMWNGPRCAPGLLRVLGTASRNDSSISHFASATSKLARQFGASIASKLSSFKAIRAMLPVRNNSRSSSYAVTVSICFDVSSLSAANASLLVANSS
mmetsp:Transcript_25443/g.58619  ORF Transcript_25443/g.58619 Transcript_25443/m.58619 type:complete len:215 (+) Transcript_25443:232-876(+)